jgi:bis(5'-nucleosyl)-tetraphosphatase (symmetrical)
VQPIFVGDVQGCWDEFEEMLGRAEAAFGDDFELFLVGDLVNRGPASRRVLERVRERIERGRARMVLGNHEISMIATYLGVRPARVSDTFRALLDSPDAGEWVEWLRRRPLVETGRVGARPFALAHAAVHPDWDLETLRRRARRAWERLSQPDLSSLRGFLKSDPDADPDRDALALLTTCRSTRCDGGWSPDPPAAATDAWHERWASRRHEYGVVYGHWSLQGLHVAPGLRGLDTGCVHHGRGRTGFLTAWIPDLNREDPFALPDAHLWQVAAKRRYIRDDGFPLAALLR